MTALNPNETARTWHPHKRLPAVHLYITGMHGDASSLAGAEAAGFPLHITVISLTDFIDPEELSNAAAAVIQVDPDSPASVKRFQKLARNSSTPLIAAAYDPSLTLVRALVRAGAHDVIPLPLAIDELETSLAPIREQMIARQQHLAMSNAKLVSFIKSVGGVGATALASQLAVRFAAEEASHGRQACLIDLDVQFGDAAFQLGLRPKLSIADLLEAGSRLDSDLLRAAITEHPSGLKVIAAPPEMMPLEGISSDQVVELVDLARREFGTVFVDLPANWTNWSLSLLARSDLVLLITELTIPSLHRAKRQLDLMRTQELGDLPLRVVANRFEKSALRTVKAADVAEVLGHELSYTVANEPALMRTAIDQGIPIGEVKRRSAVGRDIDSLSVAVAAALGLER